MFGVVSVHKTMTNSSFIRNPFHNHNAVCSSPVQFGAVVPSCLVFVCRRHANNFSVLNYTVSHFHRILTPSQSRSKVASLFVFVCACAWIVYSICWRSETVRRAVMFLLWMWCTQEIAYNNKFPYYYTVWIFAFKSQIIIWINCGIVCAFRGKSVPAVLCVMWSGKRTGQINNHACWMNKLLTVNNQCDSLAHLKF